MWWYSRRKTLTSLDVLAKDMYKPSEEMGNIFVYKPFIDQ